MTDEKKQPEKRREVKAPTVILSLALATARAQELANSKRESYTVYRIESGSYEGRHTFEPSSVAVPSSWRPVQTFEPERAALAVGALTLEAAPGEFRNPYPEGSTLSVEEEKAEPLCEDCQRGTPLSADGTNHIFGEQVGDVRPCDAAANFYVDDSRGVEAVISDALDFARRCALAERSRFIVYKLEESGGLSYRVRRESLKLNFLILRGNWSVAKTVEPLPASAAEVEAEARTKKEAILRLYEEGTTEVAEIVKRVKARPSYVAQVLQQAGHLSGYFDLYQTTGAEANVYTRYFRNVLNFRNVEAARESVQRLDRLYNYFERLGDRAGQHQACVIALLGKNRARWSGKIDESQVFHEWLVSH